MYEEVFVPLEMNIVQSFVIKLLQRIQGETHTTIMKVSSKSLNYLPIFLSNSMVDRKVDS